MSHAAALLFLVMALVVVAADVVVVVVVAPGGHLIGGDEPVRTSREGFRHRFSSAVYPEAHTPLRT